MSPLSFPGTNLGVVNHTGVCAWGSERRAGVQMGCGQVASWGYLGQQEPAASNGLQLWVTLPDSPATLAGPFSLAQERGRKKKKREDAKI